MAKSAWIGAYSLHYEWYNTIRDKWIAWDAPLGHCLGEDEAISKAIAYLLHQNLRVRDVYIVNGWGQIIYMAKDA